MNKSGKWKKRFLAVICEGLRSNLSLSDQCIFKLTFYVAVTPKVVVDTLKIISKIHRIIKH